MLAIIFSFFSFLSPAQELTHPGYRVTADTIRLASKKVRTDTAGRFLSISRVFIIGNRITRDQIILRELSLKPGDIVHTSDLPSLLDLDRKKLINTRLFNTVVIRTLALDSQKIDLLVDVKERWYTFPSPILELADRNFNDWWQNYGHDLKRINYGLKLYQFNMRGRNETLRLLAQFGFQRRFELLYRFPYIDRKQKQGLAFEFGYQETNNLAFRTGDSTEHDHIYRFITNDRILRWDRTAAITYTYRNSFYKTHTVSLQYRNMSVTDTVKKLNPNYIRGEANNNQEYFWIGYLFNADHRDYFAYPLKGYQFSAGASKMGLLPGDDVNKFDISLLYSRHFDLKKGFYLANNTVAYWSSPDDLSYTNYSALGLKKQFVRGYELYIIEGPYYFLNKTTFKKLIFSNTYHWQDMPIEQFRHIPISIYLKTYADLGYVKNYPDYEKQNFNTTLTNTLLGGAGFGIDLVSSYDVVIRFEYSFNVQGQNGFFLHLKKEF